MTEPNEILITFLVIIILVAAIVGLNRVPPGDEDDFEITEHESNTGTCNCGKAIIRDNPAQPWIHLNGQQECGSQTARRKS